MTSLWMPSDGALHGLAFDNLMRWNLIAVALLFIFAHLLLAFILLQRGSRSRPRLWQAEFLPLALFCGLYLWMAVTAQHLWALNHFEGPSPAAMQVEIVGVQFQWYFRYPGQNAAFGTTKPELVNAGIGNPLGIDSQDEQGNDDIVTSELILPAGREADLRLRALDVIHGLFIPGMRVKQNAVPGLTLHVHFTPQVPGEYPILCTQVCGLGHGHMEAKLDVLPPEVFDLWLQRQEEKRSALIDQTSGAE